MNDNSAASSLIRDLKSQIRKDKLFALAKAHQKTITYCLSLVILVAVLLTIFSFYTQIQATKYSTILHQAMIDERNGEKAKSEASLKEIYESSAPAGVKSIASLKYAAILMKDGKTDEAIEAYLTINKNRRFDAFVREYSGLVALKTLVDADKKENQEKVTALIAKLEKSSKTLKFHILEQKGLFLWNSGDFKGANEVFKSITENLEAPDMLRKRTTEMANIYKSRFGEEVAVKVEDKKSEEKKDESKTDNQDKK
jgi:hypothetical protein